MIKIPEIQLSANQRDREEFFRELILELAQSLQNVVGLEEAEGFVKMVGLKIGQSIYDDYNNEFAGKIEWSIELLAQALLDLKLKIKGGFKIESIEEDKIVLVNDACPFGQAVEGRPSLCQMTSSVFGKVASEVSGEANVYIDKAIARGDSGCRVVVSLTAHSGRGVNFYKA